MARWLVMLTVTALIGGCGGRGDACRSYETLPRDPRRDGEKACAETARGRKLLEEGRLDEAESAFKAALTADIFHGPAHNNLGIAYARQRKYYLAAWEFQYAAKVMPNQPQPRNNLGMVMEAVGQMEQASERYSEALELEPDNPEFIGNLARCRLRQGQRDARTRQLLQDLLLKDTRPDWIAWARRELIVTRSGTEQADAPATQPGDSGVDWPGAPEQRE